MSARETHITEFGLGLCAGVVATAGWYANIEDGRWMVARGPERESLRRHFGITSRVEKTP